MIVALNDIVSAVDRIKAIVTDVKNENTSILFKSKLETGTLIVAHADGKKAVCSEIEAYYEEGEQFEEEFIAPFKQVMEAIEVMKPSGCVQVDSVNVKVEPDKKMITFCAEKYIQVAGDEEDGVEVSKQIISRMEQGFAYKLLEEDKRQRILKCVDYESMLNLDAENTVVDSIGRDQFMRAFSKTSTEDGQLVIVSAKTNSAKVANVAFAVCVPFEDKVSTGFCAPVKTVKQMIEVFKRTTSEGMDIQVDSETSSAVVCSSDKTVAFWFTTEKPSTRVVNILTAYEANQFNEYRITVVKDAIENIVKCADPESTSLTISFYGNAVDGFGMNIDTGNKTGKANKFRLAATSVEGDTDTLTEKKFTVTTETLKNMIGLCDAGYIGLDFGVIGADSDNNWEVRVCTLRKDAGVISRDTLCYGMAALTK